MQTALAKLYVAWPRASRADSVDAYVRRVIINSHLDETRRPWRRESPTEDDRLDRAAPAGVAPEDADALWAALKDLGPKQRRVVVLRHYWGLSVEETAADLGVSPGTVKSQTSAALEKLRTALLTDTTHPRRTAMTDPADRFLEEKLHALARGVSVPLVPTEDDVRRGRRRLFRMRVAMAGATTAALAVVLGVTSLTAGDPKATEPPHGHPATEHAALDAEQLAVRRQP